MSAPEAAAIYARVSSEQQVQAHTSQVAALREKVSGDGLELTENTGWLTRPFPRGFAPP